MPGWLDRYVLSPKKKKDGSQKGDISKKKGGKTAKLRNKASVDESARVNQQTSVGVNDESWTCSVCDCDFAGENDLSNT